MLTRGQTPCEVDTQTKESLSSTSSGSFWIITSSWKGCCLTVVRTSLVVNRREEVSVSPNVQWLKD